MITGNGNRNIPNKEPGRLPGNPRSVTEAFQKAWSRRPKIAVHDPVVIADSRAQIDEHSLPVKYMRLLWGSTVLGRAEW